MRAVQGFLQLGPRACWPQVTVDSDIELKYGEASNEVRGVITILPHLRGTHANTNEGGIGIGLCVLDNRLLSIVVDLRCKGGVQGTRDFRSSCLCGEDGGVCGWRTSQSKAAPGLPLKKHAALGRQVQLRRGCGTHSVVWGAGPGAAEDARRWAAPPSVPHP